VTVDLQPLKALYYPSLRPAGIGWAKAVLLYWEGLRIVPERYARQDPPDMSELAAERLIEDVAPGPFHEAAREAFLTRLRSEGHSRSTSLRPRDEHAPRDPERYELLRAEDLAPGLVQELRAFGLAEEAGDLVVMAAPVAALYRTALTEVVGRALHAVTAADRPMSEMASLYRACRESALASRSPIRIDGYALARSLHPFRSLEAAPFSNATLVRTRQKLVSERRAFREHVQSRAIAIAELPSEDAIRSHMADCAHEIQRAAHAERRGRRASNVRQAWKVLAIAGPASAGVTAVAAGAPQIIGAVGGAGSVGAGVTDWISGRFQRRPTPFQYLRALEHLIGRRASGKL
jgi:hypothetical protein